MVATVTRICDLPTNVDKRINDVKVSPRVMKVIEEFTIETLAGEGTDLEIGT